MRIRLLVLNNCCILVYYDYCTVYMHTIVACYIMHGTVVHALTMLR